jgi:hypothetical protein
MLVKGVIIVRWDVCQRKRLRKSDAESNDVEVELRESLGGASVDRVIMTYAFPSVHQHVTIHDRTSP